MNKLSTRLLVNTAVILLGVAILTLGCYLAVMRWGMDYMFSLELERCVSLLSDGLRFDGQGRFERIDLPDAPAVVFDALHRDYFYSVLDGQGRVLASSAPSSAPTAAEQASARAPGTEIRALRYGLPVRLLTEPTLHDGRRYYVQSGRSERFEQILGSQNSEISGCAAGFAAVVAMLAFGASIGFTVRRTMRPLLDASRVAARIEPTQPDVRLSEAKMPDEILPLIRAFNAALARLEEGYRLQQEFLADAAHELKTPLTLMRAQLEISRCACADALLLDLDRMGRQVRQLLDLAECSGRQNYHVDAVDLVGIMDDAADHLRRLARQRGVGIDVVTGGEPVSLRADRGALFVLLKNLIENALQHARPGSCVSASVGGDRVIVRNKGEGIPAADFPLLFKRFWRGAHRRDDGAGLGLSICMAIALAHGWNISAENVPDGVEFRLAFRALNAG